jgi:hypothetical protein
MPVIPIILDNESHCLESLYGNSAAFQRVCEEINNYQINLPFFRLLGPIPLMFLLHSSKRSILTNLAQLLRPLTVIHTTALWAILDPEDTCHSDSKKYSINTFLPPCHWEKLASS